MLGTDFPYIGSIKQNVDYVLDAGMPVESERQILDARPRSYWALKLWTKLEEQVRRGPCSSRLWKLRSDRVPAARYAMYDCRIGDSRFKSDPWSSIHAAPR